MDKVVRQHCGYHLVGDGFSIVDLVRSTEAVKEMGDGYTRPECRSLGDKREIHHLLYGVGCEQRKTGLAHGHNIGMVAENGQGLRGDGTRRDMKNGTRQLAGNLVHIRNHQQQTLG